MKTVLYLFLLFAVVAGLPYRIYAQVDADGEWEFVPLTGGHVSFFVPNPYNENELFAVCDNAPGSTPYAHIFYSSDRGRNWRLTGNDLLDMGEIKDMAVTKNGWLYLTYSLRRSTNWGKTWEKAQCNGLDGNAVGMTMRSMPDGRMWLLQQNPRKLFYSDDYGVNWTHFQTPLDGNDFFTGFLPASHDNLVIFGRRGLLYSTSNSGINWKYDTTLILYDHLGDSFTYKINGTLILGLWAKYSTGIQDPRWLDYYESRDSGKSWEIINIGPLHWDSGLPLNKDNSRPYTIVFSDSSMLSVHNNNLYQSYNLGNNWHKLDWNNSNAITPIYDIQLFNDTLIGSIRGLGIMRSIDTGRTWFPVESLGEMAAFDRIELKTADNYYCALLGDQGYTRYVVSTDKGRSWKEVFSTDNKLTDLSITLNPVPRYTIVLDNSIIITGALFQEKPDTVLRNHGSSSLPAGGAPVLQATSADRSTLFLSLQDGIPRQFLHSRDGGQTWIKTTCLSGYVESFSFYPSRIKPGCFIATIPSSDQVFSMGYWFIEEYGNKWTHQQWRPVISWKRYCMYGNDTFLTSWDYDFSYDYTQSFVRHTDGIAPEDYSDIHLAFSAKETVLFVHDLGKVWYYFDGSLWNKFCYKNGTPVSYYRPSSLWYEDGILWGSFPGHGLYKMVAPVITGVQSTPVATSSDITAYPNPFQISTIIEYSLPAEMPVTLTVYSSLGEVVQVLESGLRGTGTHSVEFTAPASLPSGLYLYELRTPQGTHQGRMMLAK